MIRHIVMWKFKESEGATREQNALMLKEKLEACRDAVPGIVHLEVKTFLAPIREARQAVDYEV